MNLLKAALLLALAGCGAPNISVKEKWTSSIRNYSFAPLYPMREDVFVGDIRIHRLDAAEGSGLHSRFLDRLPVNVAMKEADAPVYAETGDTRPVAVGETVFWDQPTAPGPIFIGHEPKKIGAGGATRKEPNRLRLMALPKLEAMRITGADVSGDGPIGLWNLLIGGSFEDQENVLVSLKGIETIEISDVGVAERFKSRIEGMLRNREERLAICVAAKTMGDPEFKKTAISLVTRVAYARGVEYNYGESFSAALEASASTGGGQMKADGAFKNEVKKTLGLNEIFDRPMAFGVDAIMLDPRQLHDGLLKLCGTEAEAFFRSPLSVAQTGAERL